MRLFLLRWRGGQISGFDLSVAKRGRLHCPNKCLSRCQVDLRALVGKIDADAARAGAVHVVLLESSVLLLQQLVFSLQLLNLTAVVRRPPTIRRVASSSPFESLSSPAQLFFFLVESKRERFVLLVQHVGVVVRHAAAATRRELLLGLVVREGLAEAAISPTSVGLVRDVVVVDG